MLHVILIYYLHIHCMPVEYYCSVVQTWLAKIARWMMVKNKIVPPSIHSTTEVLYA